MLQAFYKYQGTGNDFIMIDNRQQQFPKNDTKLVARLCDRKFGIGADGLILLELSDLHDFTMIYYNADGHVGSMCGNGGRCTVAFARHLGIIETSTVFDAFDGLHEATVKNNIVSLKMGDVLEVESYEEHLFLNTGSPHHIAYVADVAKTDVYGLGKQLRYGAPYFEEGSNINFVEQQSDQIFKVRTYERGVEDETLSCGTGVTAVALASHKAKKTAYTDIQLETAGGTLKVSFEVDGNGYKNIFLTGEAILVYSGQIDI